MPKTLRTRLLLTILIPMLALLVGAFFAAVGLSRVGEETSVMRDLEDKLGVLETQAEKQGIGSLDSLAPGLALSDDRLEIVPLDSVETLLPATAGAELWEVGSVSGTVTLDSTRYVYAASRTEEQVLVLLRPFPEEPTIIPGAYVALGVGFGLPAVAFAVLVSFFVARAVARRIQRVGQAGHELAIGRTPEPLPTSGPRELRELATSFNEMAGQLTRAREAEEAFLMSVSHELKTPLAAIEGYAEGLGDGVLAPEEAGAVILDESRRLERLVADLLDLARIREARFSVKDEAVDLAAVAGQVIQRHERQALTAGLDLREDVLGPAWVHADADRLLQAVSNLVENALRQAPVDSTVTVRVRDAEISVEDEGPGLDPDDVAHAFERFYLYRRYSSVRPVGTGLGLALVKELAEVMGGTVSASSRQGEGTTFTLRLERLEFAEPP